MVQAQRMQPSSFILAATDQINSCYGPCASKHVIRIFYRPQGGNRTAMCITSHSSPCSSIGHVSDT